MRDLSSPDDLDFDDDCELSASEWNEVCTAMSDKVAFACNVASALTGMDPEMFVMRDELDTLH